MYRQFKLSTKLFIITTFLGVIPLLSLALIYSYFSISNVREVTTNFTNLFASQLHASVESYVNELDNITKTAFDDNEVTHFLTNEEKSSTSEKIKGKISIDKFLYRMAILKPDIYSVMLVSNNATVYSYGSLPSIIDGNMLSSQAWFQDIRNANGQLIVSPLHKQPYSNVGVNTEVFSVGRLIKDSTGSYGVLIFEIEPYQLLKFNSIQHTINNLYQAGVVITTPKGELIFSTTPDRTKEMDNKDFLTIRNYVQSAGMVTSVIIPNEALYEKINRFKSIALFSAISIISLMLLFSFLFARNISEPIKQLSTRMREAGLGQYLQIPEIDTQDEIGLLLRSYNKMITNISELIDHVYLSQLKHKQAQFSALQSQINPHMLFNTLESIRMKAALNGDVEVVRMIKMLAKIFRFNLAKEGKINFIKDEVDYIQNYIAIQNVRFDNRFVLEIDIQEQLLITPIIRFIFQPIIENSIIHGFKNKNREWNIKIKGYLHENRTIVLQFIDNGVGIAPDELTKLNGELDAPPSIKSDEALGIGLRNIKDRIKLEYGNEYKLRLQSSEDETIVEVTIPIDRKGE
ncbi:sensor histidine kinase [Paenibacillus periandrae]|uniref:sensor histidine kinase n=1 Tax=Paenibacillus periandrae TaxID=1761741 RepID=UPI001F091389|nr:sensor histidine kinase [Paenibacillus periandrae]